MKRKRSSADEPFAVETSEESDNETTVDPNTPITLPETPLCSGRKILNCPFESCLKSFNRKCRLTEHLRSHTNERPFSCSKAGCSKAFLRDSHLKHHLKSAHTIERNYICDWTNCDKRFATGTRLRRHQAGHATKEKYTCKGFEGCSETFRKHATLSRHILSVHEKKKPFLCTEFDSDTGDLCGSAYDTAEKLRSHSRAVHDRARFGCENCGAGGNDPEGRISFATYALLQDHISEVHPPACPQCSLACASEKDLRRHLELAHNILIPKAADRTVPTFPCIHPSCNRSFTKKGNLNVHVKTVHEHRKDFECGVTELMLTDVGPEGDSKVCSGPEIVGCGRHFTSKATLEEHVRTVHLGMNSRRQERNMKKRAAATAAEQPAAETHDADHLNANSKPKKARRDPRNPGPTKSIIAGLTGFSNLAQCAPTNSPFFEPEPTPTTPNPFHAHHQQQQQQPQQPQQPEVPLQLAHNPFYYNDLDQDGICPGTANAAPHGDFFDEPNNTYTFQTHLDMEEAEEEDIFLALLNADPEPGLPNSQRPTITNSVADSFAALAPVDPALFSTA